MSDVEIDELDILRKRVAEQRKTINRLQELRAKHGNRADRQRMSALERALGNMTLMWQREKEAREALSKQL